MIPRADLLVKDSRIASLEKDYGDTYGIGQDFFIVALNEANLKLQQHLVDSQCEPFSTYKDYTISSASETFTQPDDIFSNGLIYEVRYSPSDVNNFGDPLDLMSSRGFNESGEPSSYMVENNIIYVDPIPSTGILRVKYEGRISKLDYRRGTVESSAGSLPTPTSIVLVDDSTLDADAWTERTPEYICIVDWRGNILMRDIWVSSYDSTTRTITIRSGFTAQASETLPNGSFVVFGPNCSTHSFLPDVAELFYLQFIKDEVQDSLSSDDQRSSYPKQEAYLKLLIGIYDQLPSGFSRIHRVNKDGC